MDMEKLKEQLLALKDAVAAIVDGMAEEVKPEAPAEEMPSEMPAEENAEVLSANLAESATGANGGIKLAETEAPANGPRSPLSLDVVLIQPGWGNARDKNFYSREVLERDAKVFEGAKMYATDHIQGEKNVRSEVSRVDKIIGFTEKGAPIARVTVFDPGFAEAVRNRNTANALDSLECSILATGSTRPGTIDGKAGNIVEGITAAHSVDWVTKAGAGGRALRIAESDKTSATTFLSEAEVEEGLKGVKLPATSIARLKEGAYTSADALKKAAYSEILYVKELTRSGQPVNGFNQPAQGNSVSLAEVQKAQDAINSRYLNTR